MLITQCATDQGNCEAGGFDGTGGPECHCNYDDQNALVHFHSTGQAAGYIWHSELCNVDGTDIVIDRVCSMHDTDDDPTNGMGDTSGVVECGAVTGQLHISGDDGYEIFVNGRSIGSSENYQVTDAYTFEASCDEPTVYAIDAYDTGGIASVIADINHCGEHLRTSVSWRCHQFGDAGPPAGWQDV